LPHPNSRLRPAAGVTKERREMKISEGGQMDNHPSLALHITEW
jgi:hypothetical protein